jgi:hypothetical protein
MALIRDEILREWDAATARVAQKDGNLTDDQIAGVAAAVRAKLPGVTQEDITNALRSDVEKLQGEVAAADRVLKVLEAKVKERDGRLPGLPGGPPLEGRH